MYSFFAKVYDDLMSNVPYNVWVDFVKKHVPVGSNLIDLGCGTGTVAVELAKAGYQMVGVDLSSEMLTLAREKANADGVNIAFYEGDMANMELASGFDAVVSFVDSLNYLTDTEDWKKTFQNSYNSLIDGGYLLFDVHTMYKLRNVFNDFTYCNADFDLSILWNSYVDNEEQIVEHELTFFSEIENGNYRRFDETHVQKVIDLDNIEEMLKEIGFVNIEVLYDLDEEQPDKDKPTRAFVKAQKN